MMTNEQLITLIKAGDDTAEHMKQLWLQNKGFVAVIAKKYLGYEEMEDLMQQGYLGLCNAVDAYRPEEGVPFISYAAFWIRQSMQRYIEECSGTVRIPSGQRGNIQKYRKVISNFEKHYGRHPSDWEISRLLCISTKQMEQLKADARMEQITSLDKPIEGADELTLCDTVAGSEDVENDVLDKIQAEQLKAVIWPLVDALEGNMPEVIRMRYQEGKTLKETGQQTGTSLEAARQWQSKALRELRKPSRSKKLRPFLQDYIETHAYGGGVKSFQCTWTSSTEYTALGMMENG